MFIVSKRNYLVIRADGSVYKIKRDYIGEIPEDEVYVIRGGNTGHTNEPERYLAGPPQDFYDPIGGALTGLEHKEVPLLRENLIGSGR